MSGMFVVEFHCGEGCSNRMIGAQVVEPDADGKWSVRWDGQTTDLLAAHFKERHS